MAGKKTIWNTLRENGGLLSFASTIAMAILILWLNSRYVTITKYDIDQAKTEQRIEMYMADNSTAHKLLGDTLSKISLTLETMKRYDAQLADHEIRLREKTTKMAELEIRMNVLEKK